MRMGLISDLLESGHADYEAFSSAEQRTSIHKVVCTSQQYLLAFVPVEASLI